MLPVDCSSTKLVRSGDTNRVGPNEFGQTPVPARLSPPGLETDFLQPLAVGPKELSRLLLISPRQLQRLRNRGLIPAPDISISRRTVRWSLENIRAWLRAGSPTAEIWRLQRGPTRKGGGR